jgi:hypothetical protein
MRKRPPTAQRLRVAELYRGRELRTLPQIAALRIELNTFDRLASGRRFLKHADEGFAITRYDSARHLDDDATSFAGNALDLSAECRRADAESLVPPSNFVVMRFIPGAQSAVGEKLSGRGRHLPEKPSLFVAGGSQPAPDKTITVSSRRFSNLAWPAGSGFRKLLASVFLSRLCAPQSRRSAINLPQLARKR